MAYNLIYGKCSLERWTPRTLWRPQYCANDLCPAVLAPPLPQPQRDWKPSFSAGMLTFTLWVTPFPLACLLHIEPVNLVFPLPSCPPRTSLAAFERTQHFQPLGSPSVVSLL